MNKKTGFTLIELVVTVALLSIVAFMAAPNFTLMVRSNQVSVQTNSMLVAMQAARTEAVRRGETVSVCPSVDQNRCGGNWSDGWLIAVDSNTSGAVSISDDDALIQAGSGVGGQVQIIEGPQYARFLRNGARDTSATIAPMTWRIKAIDCTGDRAKIISLNMLGRAQSQSGPCDA